MKGTAYFAVVLALFACRGPAPETQHIDARESPAATRFLSVPNAPPEAATEPRGNGVMRDASGRPFGYALLGEPLPGFTASMLDGTPFDSSAIDRWTIIYVWGIWCGDSRADGPYVEALSRAIAQDPDLDFRSIHVPASVSRLSPEEMYGRFGSIDAYFQSVGYSYPVIVDTDGRLRETLKVASTPSYLVVSPDGVVRGFRTELAAADGEPVKDFLSDVARVKADLRVRARIGPHGAMGLNRKTAFTLPAVAAAFPGLEIVSVVEGDGADPSPIFLARSQDGDTRFRIAPDWTRGFVGMVSTRDPAVEGPGGMSIGTTRLAMLSRADAEACSPVPGRPDQVACRSPDGAFVGLFAPGSQGGEALLVEMQFLPDLPMSGSP